jgi:Xaa-Pro aminopeptidase
MVIPREGDPIVCSGQACQAWSKHKSRVKDVRIFPEVGEVAGTEYLVGDQFTFSTLFQELGQKHSIKRIGTVGTLIFPQIIYAQLQKTFPQAEMVNAESLIFELRVKKSENEIACMRKAAEILDESFTNAVQKIEVGWTELDIMAEIEAGILRGGAEGTAVSWDPMIPTGPEHANLCMNRNTLRKVSAGEIICLQAGAVYEGYNAALCSPFVLGKIPAEIQNAVLAANEAIQATIQSLKPGATSRQVNAAGKAVLKRTGYAQYSPYALMHNIGCLECESPWMAEDKDFPVVEGMAVCIDVFLFRLPWGSFRIENTLAVTAQGAECLTKFNGKFVARHFA